MSDAYIDTSQTYNGDGTTSDAAVSDGGVGAYNSVQSFMTVSSTAGQTRGILRRQSLGTKITVGTTLEPVNDGTFLIPLQLVGYPISKSISGIAITAIDPLTRTNGSKFSWTSTDATAGDSADWDHFWESAEVTIHQSGTDNDGLTRKLIWSEWDATNSRMVFGLWPDLPAALTTSATFDLALDTYDPGDISTITAWDSDTNARPILDGSGLGSTSYVISCYADNYWDLMNTYWISAVSQAAISKSTGLRNVCIKGYRPLYGSSYSKTSKLGMGDIYADCTSTLNLTYATYSNIKHLHFNSINASKFPEGLYLNDISYSSVNKIKSGTGNLYASGMACHLNNCELVDLPQTAFGENGTLYLQNCTRDSVFRSLEFLSYFFTIRTITSTDTAYWSVPPSGADFELYVVPLKDDLPNDDRYLDIFFHPAIVTASTSKTITVKIRPHAWTTDLTNADFWIEADYYDESTGMHRKTATSLGTGTTYADDTWNDVSITFTPGQNEVVEVRCYLSKYESGAYVLIDPGSGA